MLFALVAFTHFSSSWAFQHIKDIHANLVSKTFFKKQLSDCCYFLCFCFTIEDTGVLNSTSMFSHSKVGMLKVDRCLRFWEIYYKAEHFTLQ